MISEIEFILYVSDQARSKEFYQSILATEPTLNVPGMTEFQITNNTKLGLMPNDGIAKIITPPLKDPEKGIGIPRCELYLKVSNFDEFYQRVLSLNIKIISEPEIRSWGDKVFYFTDLDCHIIAIASSN